MTTRVLTNADIPAARAFWLRMGLDLTAADEPEALRVFLSRNPGLSWGCFDDIGLIATVLAGHDGRRGFLYHLMVDPAYHGRGLSTELMARALGGLAAQGMTTVHAFVLADNSQGLAFWASAARHGWSRRGELLLFSKTL